MYRIVNLTNKWYAFQIESLDDRDARRDIEEFTSEGTPVVLADDLDDFCSAFKVSKEDITIVDPE